MNLGGKSTKRSVPFKNYKGVKRKILKRKDYKKGNNYDCKTS